MKEGSKVCPYCGTRYQFRNWLADWEPAGDRPMCRGCVLYTAALDEAKRRAAEEAPKDERVDLSSVSAIEARLRAGRRTEPERDWAKAAAADHD